jgi:hypothetical protein
MSSILAAPRYRVSVIAALLLVTLSACGDETAPRPPVDVALNVSEFQGPLIGAGGTGDPTLRCEFTLTASARGRGTATWHEATFRTYVGKDRSTPVDSVTLAAADVRSAWGGDAIPAGETRRSRWFTESGIPFAGELEFRYEAGGRTGSTKTRFNCGPEVPPDATPPEISALSVTPPTGYLEAGQPISVSYTVTAQTGVWMTGVRISGPCQVEHAFVEGLQPSLTRTVAIPLDDCALGVPMDVYVEAIDAAGQTASRTLTTEVRLADTQAPTISPMFFRSDFGSAAPTLAGDWFVGDSIRVVFNAVDNHMLSSLVWEVLPYGVIDSVSVSGRSAGRDVWLQLKPEWVGDLQLRLYARDAGGRTSAAYTSAPGAVRVAPTIDRPTRSATVTGETRAIAVDTKRDVIYLAQGNDHRLAVFSMVTMSVTATLALPAAPIDLDLTAGGDSLLIAFPRRAELGVVDLRQPTLALATIPLSGFDASANEISTSLRVGSNGHAYLALLGTVLTARRMFELNLSTGALRTLPAAGGAELGQGLLERSHDRSVLILSVDNPWCMQRYVVATDAFGPCVEPTPRNLRPTVDGTASRTAIGLDVYDASLQLLPKAGMPIIVGGTPFTALSTDGETLFVVHWQLGVIRVRASDNRVLDRTENPIKPSMIRVSPDGTRLVTLESNFGSETKISVIDLR